VKKVAFSSSDNLLMILNHAWIIQQIHEFIIPQNYIYIINTFKYFPVVLV